MSENNKIIEINGVKFEVDARTATLRQLQTVQVGSKVKVLKDDRVYYGVVIGFEPFKENPVVIVAYMEAGYYSSPEIKFIYYSAKSKEQVIISDENDDHGIERDGIIQNIDRIVATKQREIQDLEDKKNYFLKNFKVYWKQLEIEQVA